MIKRMAKQLKGENRIEVGIVKGINRNDKNKKEISFKEITDNFINKIEKPYNKDYKENDVVLIKGNSGTYKLQEYYVYNDVSSYLYESKKDIKNIMNKSLLINKFTDIHNLGQEYIINQDEKDILKSIKESNDVLKSNLQKRFKWINLQCKVNDKLIIGLGNESVFETGITLHHTYGIPYIPGQAIKGILRNCIIQKYFRNSLNDCNKDCEKVAIKNKNFSLIFGGKNKNDDNVCGKVIFMDSFPCSDFKIKRDVMTPHHVNYYTANKASKLSLDSDKPNPIPFLVVVKNKDIDLVFDINIAISKEISDITIKLNKNVKEIAKEMTIEEFVLDNLIDVLEFHGIGAKTSVGYGYFNIDKNK